MDAVKNQDTWRSIAYWLNIEQLVALIITGNRWMIAVLSRAPYLHAKGKYYPIADLLSGLTQWKIPDPYSVRPDDDGIISFPPHLRSLSLSLMSRPSSAVSSLGTSTSEVQEVDFPASLTSLELNNDPTYHHDMATWKVWDDAFRTLTGLRSIFIAYEFTGMITGELVLLRGPYPNLTSLTIGRLDNTSLLVRQDLLPHSLTKLSIPKIDNERDNLQDSILPLVNLTSLTLSSNFFINGDHYLVRHLPDLLTELVIVDSRSPAVDSHYYIPTEVLNVLPRTITVLDVWISLPGDISLISLEQLPLRILKLTAESEFMTYGRQRGNFSGRFPALTELELTNFLTVTVPPSVTALKVAGSFFGSVDLTSGIFLQKLIIQDWLQLATHSYSRANFQELTSCTIGLRSDTISLNTTVSMLNPLILRSLTMSVEDPSTALAIITWLSTEANILTELTVKSHRIIRRNHVTPESELLFDLPGSLTTVSLNFHRAYKLGLTRIPANVVYLQLDGIFIDTTQFASLIQLKQLTIDVEAIMGVLDLQKSTRGQFERDMTLFLVTLPQQIAKVVVTRVRLEGTDTQLGLQARLNPPVLRYDLYYWFNISCRERDVRATVAEMMLTLIPSYSTVLPL